MRDRGPERHLLGVVATGDPIEAFGHPVEIDVGGQPVGELRAAAWSPRFSRNLGLALVDVTCEVGAEGTTRSPGDQRSLRLVELPFDEAL